VNNGQSIEVATDHLEVAQTPEPNPRKTTCRRSPNRRPVRLTRDAIESVRNLALIEPLRATL